MWTTQLSPAPSSPIHRPKDDGSCRGHHVCYPLCLKAKRYICVCSLTCHGPCPGTVEPAVPLLDSKEPQHCMLLLARLQRSTIKENFYDLCPTGLFFPNQGRFLSHMHFNMKRGIIGTLAHLSYSHLCWTCSSRQR